jgi:hypothetical protein
MATWTPIAATDISWTGRIVTTAMWNQYFGANGNMEFVKESFERYFQSFASTVSVPNNVLTTMSTYTIPVGWGDGLYFMSMNAETFHTNDSPINFRRQTSIEVDGVATANNWISASSVSGIKPTYNITLYRRLTAGTVINFRFFQNSATNTSFVLRASIQKVGL